MSKPAEQKNFNSTTGLPRARARFLAQAIQLEEEGIYDIVKMAVYAILGLMLAMLTWMSLTEISEVTVTGGKVVPVGHIHNIQHLEGGIIGTIDLPDIIQAVNRPRTHARQRRNIRS